MSISPVEITLEPSEYYNKAMELFDKGMYEDSVISFIMAYNLDYEKESIIKLLYDCFIYPNQQEFKDTYKTQTDIFNNHIFTEDIPQYNSLPIDFIPVSENVYYIFDRENKVFSGSIDLSDEFLDKISDISLSDDFSDVTVNFGWNLSPIHSYINAAKNRLLYFITEDYIRTLSFLKIPAIAKKYINHMLIFDSPAKLKLYLHNNTDIFIPRILYGADNEKSKNLRSIFDEEHKYRLTKEGRNESKLVLSICIPTWDRGHRALANVKRLLSLPYDSEIEIVISNNGSTMHVEEYEELSKIEDSRIVYSAFEENHGFCANIIQVIKLSNSQFSLILSDEDNLIFENLPSYLRFIKENPNLSIIRSASMQQYTNLKDCYAKVGKEAFEEFFLRDNYISGIIYNKQKFLDLNIMDIFHSFEGTPTITCINIYPHMWWDTLLTFKGDFISCQKPLIDEGISALLEHASKHDSYESAFPEALNRLPLYSSTDYRIDLHLNLIHLLNMLPFENEEDRKNGYMILSIKTEHLFRCVKYVYLEKGISDDEYCLRLKDVLDKGIDLLKPKADDNMRKEIELFNIHLTKKLSGPGKPTKIF